MSPYPIDLHTHTDASDGADSPADLVRNAAAAGIRTLGVTDHDTVAGLAAVAHAAERAGITFIPGVEISTSMPFGEHRLPIHLLGYGFDPEDEELLETLATHERARVVRMGQLIERVNVVAAQRGLGQDVISPERVIEIAGPRGTMGRPHLAKAMVEAKLVDDKTEAFDEWIGRDRPAYVRRAPVDTADMIRLIRRAGGVPVLAHPQEYGGAAVLERILPELKAAGLLGMEVDYGDYDDEVRSELRDVAERHGLIPLGGSDYHGLTVKETRPLGMIEVDPAAVERLQAAIQETQAERRKALIQAPEQDRPTS